MFNSVVIFSPDGTLGLALFQEPHRRRRAVQHEGHRVSRRRHPLGRWGTLICFDRQVPETTRILAVKGAQFVLVPSWGGYGEMNDIMMRVRAYENGVWLAFVHPKRCLIVDPRGNIVASNTGEDDQIVTARIDPAASKKGLLERRRPELYRDILQTAK